MKRLLTLGLFAVLVLSTVGCCRPLINRPLLQGGLFNCDPCQTSYEGGVIISDDAMPVPANANAQ
jgi:hypothetical protein